MAFLVTTVLDPKFLAGFLTCLALWGFVFLVQHTRCIRLKPGSLAYEVEIDALFRQTWNVGYATAAEVPIRLCDCGRTVRYAGRSFRVERFYGGPLSLS